MQTQTSHQQQKIISTRRITICSKTFGRLSGRLFASFPVLTLTGKWLQDTGFKIGHVVDIACEAGKLIITLSDEQRYIDK